MFNTPFGDFSLQRYPQPAHDRLQAWSAADQLLLEAAAAIDNLAADSVLTVNDEHGALSIPLSGCSVWTDSKLSQLAIAANAETARVTAGPVHDLAEKNPAPRNCELVLLRIPKQIALLRWQLQRLREALPAGTLVLSAGMDKHLPRSCADLLEQFLGPTERHRGRAKARLFSTRSNPELTAKEPTLETYAYPELGLSLQAAANVFSREQLDIGSRALLQTAQQWPHCKTLLDLGCGTGVLGISAAQRGSAEDVIFVDESSLALHSARANADRLLDQPARTHFLHSDGLRDYPAALPLPELILCNPPFHQGHVVDEWFGKRLLNQSADVIAPAGELWLVANAHLHYRGLLGRRFAEVTEMARNKKFVVYRAQKPIARRGSTPL